MSVNPPLVNLVNYKLLPELLGLWTWSVFLYSKYGERSTLREGDLFPSSGKEQRTHNFVGLLERIKGSSD
jgi:hypothetical protein